MMEGFGEIMTLEETAKYLKIGKSTLYKMAREGKIPAGSSPLLCVKSLWHLLQPSGVPLSCIL